MLKNVGYGRGLQIQPKRVLESKGFKIALAELGLTEDLVTTALVEDINGKPRDRVRELKLGAEILGMVKRDDPDDKPRSTHTTYNFMFSAETKEKVKQIEDSIKAELIKPHVQGP